MLMEVLDTANEFNSHFREIGPKLAKNIISVYGGLMYQHSCSSFYLHETSED